MYNSAGAKVNFTIPVVLVINIEHPGAALNAKILDKINDTVFFEASNELFADIATIGFKTL